MILARLIGLIAPFLSALAVLALPTVAILLLMSNAENARLSRDLATTRASLALAEANGTRLQADLDRQNAATQTLHDEGEARRSATEARLREFKGVALPPDWSAPLTGATACERAEEVRDRLMEMLR